MAVKSAERVLRIFEYLANYPDGLTAKEIGEALGYAPSSAFALLKTLSEDEYLSEDEGKRYALGPKLIQLGINASAALDVNKLAGPTLRSIMNTLNETVFMGVLAGDEVVYVAKVNSNKTISTNASVGSRKPVYCTGLGKAFLAFMDRGRSKKIIETLHFEPFTETTVTSAAELRAELETCRALGYAVDNGEIETGLWCVAVPIYNAERQMIAAVSVSGPKVRMQPQKELVVRTMLDASLAISRKCGCIH